MAKEGIKEKVEVTAETVGKAIVSAIPVHKEKVEQKIYVGPNLLGLPKYTVVESVKAAHIQSIIKECPEVKKMFVPIEKMSETEQRIGQKGTLEHRHYKVATEYKVAKAKERKGDK